MEITKYNTFPLIVIDDEIYNGNLNLVSFLHYACSKQILECKSYNGIKKLFLSGVIIMTVIILSFCIYSCKKNIDYKFKIAMQTEYENKMKQYGKVGKDALPESVVERLDASIDSISGLGTRSLISEVEVKNEKQ
jgi:hypothetical protein